MNIKRYFTFTKLSIIDVHTSLHWSDQPLIGVNTLT